jgi:hypothetical protein
MMSETQAPSEHDILTLVGRLYLEDPETFAPETREVMERWVPRFEESIEGRCGSKSK